MRTMRKLILKRRAVMLIPKKLELSVYDRLAKAKANPIKGNARLHTAQGFLLVREATVDVRHHPAASHEISAIQLQREVRLRLRDIRTSRSGDKSRKLVSHEPGALSSL